MSSRFPRKNQKVYQTNFRTLRVTNRARHHERQDSESAEEESKDDMNVGNRRYEVESNAYREGLVNKRFAHSRQMLDEEDEEAI